MLFSEKMSAIPQPRRADLWTEYRTLCTALSLNVRLRKECRLPTEEEIVPLRESARKADGILAEYGIPPSFDPDAPDFFQKLIEELTAVASRPGTGD